MGICKGNMKSTEKIHEIVGNMPIEDRGKMMTDLLDLRLTILDEISRATNNSGKLLRLFYKSTK